MSREHGPFDTEQQAAATAAVRRARAATDADPGPGLHVQHYLRILMDACSDTGVFVGELDLRQLTWLAGWGDITCAVFAGLIRRAHENGVAAGQHAGPSPGGGA